MKIIILLIRNLADRLLFYSCYRLESSSIEVRQMDFTDKWRIFECTFLSNIRRYCMNWSVIPSGNEWKKWPLVLIKDLGCYLLEMSGLRDICEPF